MAHQVPLRRLLWSCARLCLIALASGLLAAPAYAQPPDPQFVHLTTADGLSHNIVHCILQDHYGFMWFGTQDGLNRYDGYTFTVYHHLRSDPDSLVHNTVNVLYEDRDGTLWVGTVGGLDSFTGIGGRFIHHTALPAESISAIYQDAEGSLWVGTTGSGLFRYDPALGQTQEYRHDPTDPYSLSDNNVLSIYEDRAGMLWVGTLYGGLNALDRSSGRFVHYLHNPADPNSLSYDEVAAILEDSRGVLWVATGTANENNVGGLNIFDRASGRFTHYRYNPHDEHSLSHNHVQALYEDPSGTLWVGTEGGVSVLDRATQQFTRYRHDPLDVHSLIHNDVTAIYQDRSGTLWFATWGGVSRYAQAKVRFHRYRHDPRDPNSLGGSAVGALAEDPGGALWIGLHNNGLDRLDRAVGRFTHYQHDPNDPHSLSHNHVTALLVDHEGLLWVGTSAGLDRLDKASGGFVHYAHDPDDPHSLSPGEVKVILEDRNGDLWIGTEDPGGLSRWERQSDTFVRYEHGPADPASFPNTYGVRAIYEDSDGDLWIGTYNGLLRLDRQSGLFTRYRHDAADPHSLSDDFVWAVAQDRDGVLWVGTQRGLNRFDRSSGQFTVYGREDGLANDAIAAILLDEQGNLWLGTMGGGLCRFDPRSGAVSNYDSSDGLQGEHFIIGAAHRSRNGEMFFGGLNGLNAFYPAEVTSNRYVPPVVLTAFRVFDQVVEFETPLPEVEKITLSYRDNFFAFEFAALDYTDPARNQHAYMLEEFDQDWIMCGPRRYASYTNLPPGEYTFRVKGSNNDGLWNEEGVTVRLVITPPFWATWWFRGLVAAVVCAVGGLVYRVRAQNIAALREREERFRALFENAPLGVFEIDLSSAPPRILRANQASARIYGWTTTELASMPLSALVAPGAEADLEGLLSGLRAGETVTTESVHLRRDGDKFPVRVSAALQRLPRRAQAAIVIAEDITAEKAWRSEEEAIAEERRRIAREIHDGLAQDLAALRLRVRLWHRLVDESPAQMHLELDALRDLLGRNIREVRRAIFALRPVALDELGFYPALHQFVTDFGEQNQIDVDLRLADEVRLPASLEPVLFRIIQESLHNVARHAQATSAWVSLAVAGGAVHLTVRDNGVGFDPATLEQAERSGHVGLKQMRERVAALKGTFALHTAPGQGTEIRISLPVT